MGRLLQQLGVLILSLAMLVSDTPLIHSASFHLPEPGSFVLPSSPQVPLSLKGLTIHPEDLYRFDFIVDTGSDRLEMGQVAGQSERLLRYFLAAMTVPQQDFWVNLSPFEQDRIVPEELGRTELGRDLLAQDYLLKQLSASLLYPEHPLGKRFWQKLRALIESKFGVDEMPSKTFNKVWIVPDRIKVFEEGHTVVIVESHLKVMLDEDYQARKASTDEIAAEDALSQLQAETIRREILPEIEREVNLGEQFAPVRQIFDALILAKWYKQTLQANLLKTAYVDQRNVTGIELADSSVKKRIYEQYVDAYQKGVFDLIREEAGADEEVVPRRYFSGGIVDADIPLERVDDRSMATRSFTGSLYKLIMRIVPAGKRVVTATGTQLKDLTQELITGPLVARFENNRKLLHQGAVLLSVATVMGLCTGCMTTQRFTSSTPWPKNSVFVSAMNGDYKIIKNSETRYIYTFGLGSCGACLIVTPGSEVAALAHINTFSPTQIQDYVAPAVRDLQALGVDTSKSVAIVLGGETGVSEKLLENMKSYLTSQGITVKPLPAGYELEKETRNVLYDGKTGVVYFPYNNTKVVLIPPVDQAMGGSPVGGIDLSEFTLEIEKGATSGELAPVSNFVDLGINGFRPEIIDLSPVADPFLNISTRN